ncbi:hypothetical protein Hanom_Chr09g00780121 [Helianthus anomalus]
MPSPTTAMVTSTLRQVFCDHDDGTVETSDGDGDCQSFVPVKI